MFLYFSTCSLSPPSASTCEKSHNSKSLPGSQDDFIFLMCKRQKLLPQPPAACLDYLPLSCQFTRAVIIFSTWQAEQKKIGKEDEECICCTVPQTYGKRRGTAVSVFHAVLTCYTTLTSVGKRGAQPSANVILLRRGYNLYVTAMTFVEQSVFCVRRGGGGV